MAHVAASFLSLGVFLSVTPAVFAERSEEEIRQFVQKLEEEKAVLEADLRARSKDPQQRELEASKKRQRKAYTKMIQDAAGAGEADQARRLSEYQNFLKKERLDAAKKQKKINDEIQTLGREFKKRKNAAFETMLKKSSGADPAVQARLLENYHRFLKQEDLESQEKQRKIRGHDAKESLTRQQLNRERDRFAQEQSEKMTAFLND